MRILVADDDDVSSMVIGDALENLGFEVTVASNGREAWELIQAEGFRLLILDWMMPEIDGMEVCRRVRAMGSGAYTYIILLTGRTDRKDRLEALDGGVDDFLPKPLDQGELRARLKAADRILRSEEAIRLTNQALTEARESELRTGGAIQRRLLHTPAPRGVRGLSIENLNLPSNEVDGDFVDFFVYGDGVLDVVAADVMGKGVPAALMGAGVKTTLERLLISLMGSGTVPEPRVLMERLDKAVGPELIELESFLTLCYARIDPREGLLSYINCGHPRLVHWRAVDASVSLMATTSTPLGFVADGEFETVETRLLPGDLLVFYSDGITDLPKSEGGRLGMGGFAQWIQPRGHLLPGEILAELRSLRESAPGPASARDDFSCVVVRFTGPLPTPDTLSLWADAGSLEKIRRFVRDAAEATTGFTRTELGELKLAVQEAASNAVRHARPEHGAVPLTVQTSFVDGCFGVDLMYPGAAFDPAAVPPPAMDGSRDGGFGLSIIRRCVDEMRYVNEAGMNRLSLRKSHRG